MRPETFQDYVQRQREAVDQALRAWLPAPPACPPLLAEAMNYSLEAGGKRLRPILTLAAADAIVAAADRAAGAATSSEQAQALALPAACAIELIHTYSLIHDDLPAMDDDTLRRGRPTLHVVYGDGIAILAGDGLLTEAFALLAREPRAGADDDLAARKLRVIERIADRRRRARAWWAGRRWIWRRPARPRFPGARGPSLDARGLQAMHAMKTGALIRASAVSGAIMAGGSEAQVAAVDRFASEVGLVFQIVDDILDVEGAADQLGKTAGKDAADDKPTYPALFGLDAVARRWPPRASRGPRRRLPTPASLENQLMDIADWVIGRRN